MCWFCFSHQNIYFFDFEESVVAVFNVQEIDSTNHTYINLSTANRVHYATSSTQKYEIAASILSHLDPLVARVCTYYNTEGEITLDMKGQRKKVALQTPVK